MNVIMLLICLFISILNYGKAQNDPIVMFRLQGIQSFWCTDMVKTVTDEFLSRGE